MRRLFVLVGKVYLARNVLRGKFVFLMSCVIIIANILNMNNLHRIFIAISLPEKLRNLLAGLQDKWLELPAKWARPESLHITLNFLGNTNDQEMCDICALAMEVARRHDPFDLKFERVCYGPLKDLPAGGAPRMIWALGEKSDELGSLQRDLENTLHEFAGADSESGAGYSFSPHITLARINQAALKQLETEEIPAVDEPVNRTFMVESIEVMESETKRGGPVYTVLESIKLGE